MSFIDEMLRDAISRGEFDNLPGAGKPLKLEDDAHTPEHLRLAHKLLKDNDLVPDWIAQGKVIDAARAQLARDLRTAVRQHRAECNDAVRSASPKQAREHANVHHQAALAALEARAVALNRQILSYNLKIPRAMPQKRIVDFAREVENARAG